MAYYSVRLSGGTVSEVLAIREAMNGKRADYTPVPGFFYVERSCDARRLKQSVEGLAGDHIKVVVEEITSKEFHW